jgi:hypothetical protein
MNIARDLSTVLALSLLLGCARDHLPLSSGDTNSGSVVGPHAPNPTHYAGTGAETARDAAADSLSDAGVHAAASIHAFSAPSDAGSPLLLASPGTELWVGQIWSDSPTLCDPAAPVGDWDNMIAAAGYTERAVLVLKTDATGELGGQIQFGLGQLPRAPQYAACDANPGDDSFFSCSHHWPAKGAIYDLLDARRTSNELTFRIAPNQVWQTWCSASLPTAFACPVNVTTCLCDDQHCAVSLTDTLTFRLVVTADGVEGQAPFGDVFGAGFGTPVDIRLHRAM